MQHLLSAEYLFRHKPLRYYQQGVADRCVEAALVGNNVCGVIPTGGGKSLTIAEISRQLLLSPLIDRVVLLCRFGDILDQLAVTAQLLQLQTGWIRSKFESDFTAPLQIASCGTVVARRDAPRYAIEMSMLKSPRTAIIADECHTSLNGMIWDVLTGGRAALIGLTATPWLTGNRSLAEKFNVLVPGPTPLELMQQGFLTWERFVTPETISAEGAKVDDGDWVGSSLSRIMRQRGVTERIVETVFECLPVGKLIFFVTDRLHAAEVARCIDEHGRKSVVILDDTEDRTNEIGKLRDCRTGATHGVSIDILGTGIDIPDLAGIVMLRHTMSPQVYFQQLGRPLRTFPGKECAYIFDFVGNLARHCKMSDITGYSFDDVKPRGERSSALKICPMCQAEVGTLAMRCHECSFLFEDSCEECDADMYAAQTVCRSCGWDRRTAEEKRKEESAALKRLELLRQKFSENYFIDSVDEFRYNWYVQCSQAWSGQAGGPREMLNYLQSCLAPGVDVESLAPDTCHTLWQVSDAESAYVHYSNWLREHKTGATYTLQPEEVHTLFALEFGHVGRQWLTKHVREIKASARKARQWFKPRK